MEEKKEPKITDADYIAEWRSMLKIFHNIKPKDPKAKEKYMELKELAKNSARLTPRQHEGINDRCDNAINETYGKTKTDAQLNWHTPPVTKEQSNGKP